MSRGSGLALLEEAIGYGGDPRSLGTGGRWNPRGSALGASRREVTSNMRDMLQELRSERGALAAERRTEATDMAARAAMGRQNDDELKRAPLGLGDVDMFEIETVVVLTSTSQKPFQGSRLFLVGADTGAAAASGIDLVTGISVGVDNQLVGLSSMPMDAFAADSIGVGLTFSLSGISQQMTVNIRRNPAPGAALSGAQRTYSGLAMGATVRG